MARGAHSPPPVVARASASGSVCGVLGCWLGSTLRYERVGMWVVGFGYHYCMLGFPLGAKFRSVQFWVNPNIRIWLVVL